MDPGARTDLVDAARAVVESAEGMNFGSGTSLAFTRGLADLRKALAGPVDTDDDVSEVLTASRKVVGAAHTDDLIKARRGATLVGALRRLRGALRELD